MSQQQITITRTCDRCSKQFTADSMAGPWWAWGALTIEFPSFCGGCGEKDLCGDCRTSFGDWWKDGPK